MTLPRDLRGGREDGIVDRAWNPLTATNDLKVTIPGEYLDRLWRYGLAGFHEAQYVPGTLRNPLCVYETDSGNFMHYGVVKDRSGQVFCVRVRPTGWRGFRWQFEDADREDPSIPASRGPDRFKRRVR